MRLLLALLCVMTGLYASAGVANAGDCYFECVKEIQVNEYTFDLSSTPNCCYVTNGGGTGMDVGVVCTGQHSPEKTCYDAGFKYGSGAGCICHGVGEFEQCSPDITLLRTNVSYACAVTAGGKPYCAPTLGADEPFTTSVPQLCE